MRNRAVLFEGEALEWAKVKARAVNGWKRVRIQAVRDRESIDKATADYIRTLKVKGLIVSKSTLFTWARSLQRGGLQALANKLPRCIYRKPTTSRRGA